ncbi:MAG: DUF3795 domain-containing protein [Eubacteriales bacterium]|nr:DUF3795 domain-containing protein [Eubacteriales bacterium]
MNISMNKISIAPCGMNCAICLGYLREKNKCSGCNSIDGSMPNYCGKCIIRKCKTIADNKSGFCYECGKYPCLRLRQLDKRYRTRYGMSMLENLTHIRDFGIDDFLRKEEERWKCKSCGATVCVHRKFCLHCKEPRGE